MDNWSRGAISCGYKYFNGGRERKSEPSRVNRHRGRESGPPPTGRPFFLTSCADSSPGDNGHGSHGEDLSAGPYVQATPSPVCRSGLLIPSDIPRARFLAISLATGEVWDTAVAGKRIGCDAPRLVGHLSHPAWKTINMKLLEIIRSFIACCILHIVFKWWLNGLHGSSYNAVWCWISAACTALMSTVYIYKWCCIVSKRAVYNLQSILLSGSWTPQRSNAVIALVNCHQ